MLDLDAIAERYARELNQDHEDWRSAIWDERFQRLSQDMTDGEIREFVSLSSSGANFLALVSLVVAGGEVANRSPLGYVRDLAERAGQSPVELVRALG